MKRQAKQKRHLVKRYFTMLVFLVFSFLGISQNLNFKNYTLNDGLPSSEVYDMIQDENGYLWFATNRGICRYNGYSFEKFGIQDGLTDNIVFRFFPQADGSIWCSTSNKELFYFHPKDYVFKTYQFNSVLIDIPQLAVINSIFLNNNGTLNVGFINQLGYLAINVQGDIIKQLDQDRPSNNISNRIVHIQINEDHQFSFLSSSIFELKGELETLNNSSIHTSNYGFFRSVGNNNAVAFIDNKELTIIKGQDTTAVNIGFSPIGVGVYDDEHFWVGYNHGGVKIVSFKGVISDSFLPGQSVSKLYKDHEGGIWISTLTSGAYYIQNNTIRTFSLGNNSKADVSSLTSDPNGNLYIACYNGDIHKVRNNKSSLIYKSILKKPALVQFNKYTNQLYTYSDQRVETIGSLGSTNILKSISILCFSENQESEIIIGGYGGFYVHENVTIINNFHGLKVNGVAKINRAYYIASLNGLYKYQDGELTDLSKENELLAFRFSDVDVIDKTLYLSSSGAGIVVSNKDTTFNIGNKHGLFSNNVSETYVENDSTIWVCTSAGLNKIQFSADFNYQIAGVSYNDGLINNEVTDVEVVDSVVWVGTRDGLLSFSSSLLDVKNVESEKYLSFTEIMVNDETLTLNELENLDYSDNRLDISYHAISFRNNDQLSYRFKLEGLENKWNHTDNLQLSYPSLPPGEYIFILQVKGQGGVWSEDELKFKIHISPPFYQTTWFKLVILIFLGILIYLFFKFRVIVYNRDVIGELIRLLIRKLKGDEHFIIFRELGADVKIKTLDILYVKSANNYIEVFTDQKTYTIRYKIGQFLDLTPDPLEYIRIHRSYIIRIDKVNAKTKSSITINNIEIPVSETYLSQLNKIQF